MWEYESSTGKMYSPDGRVFHGYSGRGVGKNNPFDPTLSMPDRADLQALARVGPIPEGKWHIGPAFTHPHLGALAMPLIPDPGTQTYGRTAFYIHADSVVHPGLASEGCIVLDHASRAIIADSHDRLLVVVCRRATMPVA